MSKPLTMSEGSLDTIRLLLSREPEHVQKNAKALLAEVYALRAALAAAEAKLADAEKHADELAAELEKCNDRAYRNAQIAAHYCASKGVSENFMGKQSRKYMDTVFVLTAHAARRAARDGQEGTR